jgi:hypothetical protein
MSQRKYGWSPKQMARINAQREARGQTPYVDKRMESDEAYREQYQQAGDDYSSFQKKIAERNAMQSSAQEDRNKAFAERSASMRTDMQKREQERQNLGRMNVDYLKMKQSGGDMSWQDFKKMWTAPKVSTPPMGMGGMRYA